MRLNVPDRLVYSSHDYPASLFAQVWFADPTYPANLPAVWDRFWGYLHRDDIAPVLLGEFGSKLETTSDRQWLDSLTRYLGTGADGGHWTFWSWNPNSSDTGGILRDDWRTINLDKQSYLAGGVDQTGVAHASILFPLDGGPAPTVSPGGTPTPTPVRTPTPRPTATPTASAAPTPCTGCPTPGPATLEARHRVGDAGAPTDNQLKPHLELVNRGTTSVALSRVSVRYWYTSEGTQAQSWWCDWATIGCGNVTGNVTRLATARPGANGYLEVRFAASAGSLAPGASTGEIQSRVAKSDWTAYDERDDWSYDAARTSFTTTGRVTAYVDGVLAWGSEPGGGATATPAPTPTATRTPSPAPTATRTPAPTPTVRPTATTAPTATPTRTPTPTPTRTPAPTPTRTPTPTGSPAPSITAAPSGLTASVVIQSSWSSGYCARIAVTNRGTTARKPRWLRFRLATSATISNAWNGTVKRNATLVDVTLPDWVATLAPGASSQDFGFCTVGTARPTLPEAG